MAQSELTVTPPSPTPPTNMSFTGATAPNPPNYTKLSYAGMEADPPTNPPPYFDDGAAGSLTAFATQTGSLAGGSGVTAGGTEGSYPGTGSPPYTLPNNVGAVPASSSVAHEGAGTEVVVTAPGSRTECPTVAVSDLGNFTATPNADHASAKAPAVLATITALAPVAPLATGGTTPLTVTGTGFRPQSVVNIGGVPYPTTYVSATTLTVQNAPKRTTAGTTAITVTTNGATSAAASPAWTFT